MTSLGSDSFGSLSGVARLTPRFASGKGDNVEFTDATLPTRTQVDQWLTEVSALLSLCLRAQGYLLPLVTEEVRLLIDLFCNEAVSALVEGVNGAGRFGTSKRETGIGSSMRIILEEAKMYIESLVLAGVLMGESQDRSLVNQIGFKEFEKDGTSVFPIFQRQQYEGERDNFINWEDQST